MNPIRVGSRESRLAVVQAEEVIRRLGVPCELVTMKTKGDRILDRTLDQVGGKGLFVRELDRALAAGKIDLAVHSLKDLPMEQPEGLPVVAYPEREDARDALVLPAGRAALDPGKPIGCASARRRLQLEALFPGHRVEPVRGNVLTRLEKLDGGQYGALVLAVAGLRRLGLKHRIARRFSPEELLPAAGQGILAVQARAGEYTDLLKQLDYAEARACALAERAVVRGLDGGCFAPIGAYAELEHDRLWVRGFYAQDGAAVKAEISGPASEAERLGFALAERLLRQVKEG